MKNKSKIRKKKYIEVEKQVKPQFNIFFIFIIFSGMFIASYCLDGGITGFAIFETSSQSGFDEGTYFQTFYNNSGCVQLNETSTVGTYTSKVFNAGSNASWNNISWDFNLQTIDNNLAYFSDGEAKSYYPQNSYSVRTWFNVSNMSDFSQLVVYGVYDCDGGCSGSLQVRIGNSTNWGDYTLVDASNIRTDGTTSNYTWYNNTFDIGKNQLGDYFFVQNLIFTGSGTIRFLMDESGPAGPDPEFRSGSDGDGSQTGWNDDNGDYAINISTITKTRLNISIRSCDDPSCSGENFVDIEDTSPQNLSVINNTYFQYDFKFESDDASYSPELYDVAINYTVIEAVDNPPNVSLIEPVDGYYNDSSDPVAVFFNCSVTDDDDAVNISLYITNNQKTSFAFNNSCDVAGVNGSCNWTLSLSNGNYTWNCLAYDNASQSDWNSNRSISINRSSAATPENDTTAPNVILVYPTNGHSFTSTNNITFNVSATDNVDLDNCTLWTNISGWQANDTKVFSDLTDSDSWNYHGLDNGTYIWNAYCCDNLSNCAWNESNSTFIIAYSPSPPQTTIDYNLTYIFDGTTTTNYGYLSGTLNAIFYNDSIYTMQLNSTFNNGTYTSQVFDVGVDSQWNNISWVSNAIGELPSNEVGEVKFGSGNVNMTGNLLLLHLDEVSGSIIDYSGNGNDGTYNGALYSQEGKLNTAIGFDGNDDYIDTHMNYSLTGSGNAFSVFIWVKNIGSCSGAYVMAQTDRTGSYSSDWILGYDNGGLWADGATVNGNNIICDGDWHHLGFISEPGNPTYNSSLYIDGNYMGSCAGPGIADTGVNSVKLMTRGDATSSFVSGLVDEVAIWNRSLSQQEILDIYQRGVLRLNLSVRSCDDVNCDTEVWENINGGSSQNLSLANNIYFQYKFEFETDNISYSPELYNVTIDHTTTGAIDNNPSVNLIEPVDNFNSLTGNITFECNASDDNQVENITLYANISGTWQAEYSNNASNLYYEISGITDGIYRWNCLAYDNASQSSWGTQRTINIALDSDGDGVPDEQDTLEGNEDDVTRTGITNLNITVGGNSTNGTFEGEQEVIFYDGTDLLMNFTHNFSAAEIDLSKISIEVTSSSIVVNLSSQLLENETKSLYVDDNSFISLCVSDTEIVAVSQISDLCNQTGEIDFTVCLGNSTGVTNGSITCFDEGTRIRVENLTHSGIRGTQAGPSCGDGSCNGGETCSSCPQDCGICGGGGSGGGGGSLCTSNWECKAWSQCQYNGTRTRSCTDTRNCRVPQYNPAEVESCKYGPITDFIKEKITKSLFDIKIELKNAELSEKEALIVYLDLINVKASEQLDVEIEYTILDLKENVLYRISETRAVDQTLSYKKIFAETELKTGEYILKVNLFYGDNQTSSAEHRFRVTEEKNVVLVGTPIKEYNSKLILFGLLGAIVIILISLIVIKGIYPKLMKLFSPINVKNILEKKKVNRSVKIIVQATPFMKTEEGQIMKLEDSTGEIYGLYHQKLKGKMVINAKIKQDEDKNKFLNIKKYKKVNMSRGVKHENSKRKNKEKRNSNR